MFWNLVNPGYGPIALIEGVGGVNAASPSMQKLVNGNGDINWVVCADSTTNQTGEFLYLWFADLALDHPEVTFEYYPPDGSGGYGAVVVVQTGSGANTFRLYNNSVSGTTPTYFMGSLFDGAFVTPGRDWDVILWNHGKNYVSVQSTPIVQGQISAAIAQVQLAFPSAQHIAVLQYPQRDDNNMALIIAAWRDIAANAPGISLMDMSSAAYESGDYTDNTHLTLDANAAKLLPLMQAWWNSTRAGSWTPETPWLETLVANLLDGASGEDYANFALDGVSGSVPGAATGGVPFGWTNSGTVAYDQEAVIVYDGAPRSQKMQGSGSGPPVMYKGLAAANINAMKGQYVMLTALQYIDAGAAATVGRLSVSTNGTGGVSVTSRADGLAQGAWRVMCLGPFLCPSDMSTSNTFLYHDSSSTPDTDDAVYYQWACLSVGKLPRAPT